MLLYLSINDKQQRHPTEGALIAQLDPSIDRSRGLSISQQIHANSKLGDA